MEMINPNAAGIDVGSEEHWVAVPEDRDEQPIRSFGCFTADLHALADWLEQCGIETVAMESTSVYWIPLFQILETRGFEVKLVNARHVKNVPGRKTDVLDCQWIQRLHSYGLLSGSFRPEDQLCVLRSYWRHRDNLVSYASAHIQLMQKALIQMNLQLHKVISDITGLTGMRIIRAVLAGERDPLKLAQMKDHRVKSSVERIAKALEGDYRAEHIFALKQAVELYDTYRQKIEACDGEIDTCLARFDSKIDLNHATGTQMTKTKKRANRSQLTFDLRSHLYRITGGRIKSSKTRKNSNRAANAFRLAAQSLARSPTALGAFYRRMRTRLGAPKAITATAHKLARIFYHMWKNGVEYCDSGAHYYDQIYKHRVLRNLKKKARTLGYNITLEPIANNQLTETNMGSFLEEISEIWRI
jgi:transposase